MSPKNHCRPFRKQREKSKERKEEELNVAVLSVAQHRSTT